MLNKIKSIASNKSDLTRKALILGGTIVGGVIAVALTSKPEPEEVEITIVEETVVTEEAPETEQ